MDKKAAFSLSTCWEKERMKERTKPIWSRSQEKELNFHKSCSFRIRKQSKNKETKETETRGKICKPHTKITRADYVKKDE